MGGQLINANDVYTLVIMCRNNAGLSLNDAPRQTKDGLEMMFAVNFIGE